MRSKADETFVIVEKCDSFAGTGLRNEYIIANTSAK